MQIAWYQIGTNVEHLFYALELTLTSVLVTNIFQFGWWRCKDRKGDLTHWQRWDAAYYLGAAVPMNLGMPLAVVLIYIGEVGYPDSKMWHSGSWMPNTPHGIILYIFKWLGVAFLTVGVLKATQLHVKIMKKWRKLRGKVEVDTSATKEPV